MVHGWHDRTALMAVAAMLLLWSGGCNLLHSRYAMDNVSYAEKYREGAEKSDLIGKVKQASDARWVEDEIGTYFNGGFAQAPDANAWLAVAGVGSEQYPKSFLSTRFGGDLMLSGGDTTGLYLGVDAGVRLQTPTRLAPFIGVGATGGVSAGDILYAILTDDDESIRLHDRDDPKVEIDGLAAVYP
ncbi:MAG: hypothetical protein AAFN70_06505, partial [Planctomycetota bacterium]